MISSGWLTIADWRIAVSNIGGMIWGIMVFIYFHLVCGTLIPAALVGLLVMWIR